MKFNFIKVFLGDNYLDQDLFVKREKFLGNTILFQYSDIKHIFINPVNTLSFIFLKKLKLQYTPDWRN